MYKLAKGANIGQSAHTSFHRSGHNGLVPLRYKIQIQYKI